MPEGSPRARARSGRCDARWNSSANGACAKHWWRSARIARELHDLVAYGVAAISVQAGVAQQWLERDPARAENALRNARRRAGTVLGEMRRLLSVLRDDDALTAPGSGALVTGSDLASPVQASAAAPGAWPSFVSDTLPALLVVASGVIELASVHAPAPAVARLLGAAAFGVVVLVRRLVPLPAVGAFALVLILRAADGQLGHASHSSTLVLLILGWSLGPLLSAGHHGSRRSRC